MAKTIPCPLCDAQPLAREIEQHMLSAHREDVDERGDMLPATLDRLRGERLTAEAETLDETGMVLTQEVSGLKAERDALKAEASRLQKIVDDWAGLVAAHQPTSAGPMTYVEGATYSTCQECVRLREALERCGSHLLECTDADTGECNCGYRAAFAPRKEE